MRRRLVITTAALLVLVVALATWRATADHASHDPERDAALKAAHQVQGTVHGTFLLATYLPDAGEHGASNTGHPCARHTLQVRLIWKAGASFTHGGVPGAPPDGPRQALVVTVNADTGTPCLIGASYSHVRPRPGELYLYGPWTAGLSRP